MDDKEKILNELYKNDLDYMCWYPIDAKSISKFCSVSLEKTRRILNSLKKDGIIKFERGRVPDRFSYEGELEEEGFFYCGWSLTEKGKSNPNYLEMQKEWLKEVEKIDSDFLEEVDG